MKAWRSWAKSHLPVKRSCTKVWKRYALLSSIATSCHALFSLQMLPFIVVCYFGAFFNLNNLYFWQVSQQMKSQTSPSSSIIIVLTDGKLNIYPYELSVQEVTHTHTHTNGLVEDAVNEELDEIWEPYYVEGHDEHPVEFFLRIPNVLSRRKDLKTLDVLFLCYIISKCGLWAYSTGCECSEILWGWGCVRKGIR